MKFKAWLYLCKNIPYPVNPMISEEKKNKIKSSLKNTKDRRKNQIITIIKTKIDMDKLNNKTVNTLKILFLESKWLYNYVINRELNDDIFKTDYKINCVGVYVIDHYEKRKLKNLSSQMKQGIIERARDNIKSLHELKNNGFKVGSLKFKPDRDNASTLKGFNISPYVSASFVSETGSLNALA